MNNEINFDFNFEEKETTPFEDELTALEEISKKLIKLMEHNGHNIDIETLSDGFVCIRIHGQNTEKVFSQKPGILVSLVK